MNKYKYWDTVNLDLDTQKDVEFVANFLQNKFCPEGADPMWSAEYFNWKLGDRNPAGRGLLSYAVHDNKVVGVASLTKKKILIDGIEYTAGEVGDTYTLANIIRRGKPVSLSKVDPNPASYINKSVFGRLISDITGQALEDDVSFIYGTPNKNSYPGYTKKLGFLTSEKYRNTRYIRPTTSILIRKHKIFKPFERVIKTFELAIISMQNYIYKNILCRGCEFSTGIPSEDEINNLWLRTKPTSGFSLVRDFLYWKHRYSDHPLASYQFFAVYKKGRLISMAVTRHFVSRENNSAISIVEWMTEESNYFSYILSSILNYFKATDVNYFYLWTENNGKYSASATRNLFVFKSNAHIIFADTPRAKSFLVDETPMEFYLGSSDAI